MSIDIIIPKAKQLCLHHIERTIDCLNLFLNVPRVPQFRQIVSSIHNINHGVGQLLHTIILAQLTITGNGSNYLFVWLLSILTVLFSLTIVQFHTAESYSYGRLVFNFPSKMHLLVNNTGSFSDPNYLISVINPNTHFCNPKVCFTYRITFLFMKI